MKIIYCLCDASLSGGTERMVSTKANYFADVLGYDVTIITTQQQNESFFYKFSSRINIQNIGINYYEIENCSFLKKIIKHIDKRKIHKKRLEDTLRKIDADIVISCYGHEFSILPKIRIREKIVGEVHVPMDYKRLELKNKCNFSTIFQYATDRFLKQASIIKYDRFVVLTKRDKARYSRYNSIVQIYNPIPFVVNEISQITSKRILSVGRLSYEKGYDLLIEAWGELFEEFPDWNIDIFGDGDEYSALQQLINKKGIKNITISPPVRNIAKEYQKSAFYVLPSRYEGFGMVLVEAMSCSLPCIAFDCPQGPSEIIEHNEDGFLVENGNIKALVDKMRLLMVDKNLRISMGKKARVNIQRFSQHEIMPQWDKLFHEIIAK